MDIHQYFDRIKYSGDAEINAQTLMDLHECHVMNVPFENLDVYFNVKFGLEINDLLDKIIIRKRGGFCYELNTIFNELLVNIGFESKIISARIFEDSGNLGPEFDHMAIIIKCNDEYLADVGFGDLFIKPLALKEGIQSDGRNLFKIEKIDNQNYILSMCSDKINFQKKYAFSLESVSIQDFQNICLDKQTNPNSYFVKNTLCTKPTTNGRMTIFNDKFIIKHYNDRIEREIENEDDLKKILKKYFEMGFQM